MLLTRTRVQFIPNTLLKVVSPQAQYAVGEKEGKNWLPTTVLVSFRSLSLPIIHHHFLFLSHQGHLPRLYRVLHHIILYGTTSFPKQYKSRMLHRLSHLVTLSKASKRDSLPKVWFLFQVHVCVRHQNVFPPSVGCGICNSVLDGRTLGRYDCEGLCSCP